MSTYTILSMSEHNLISNSCSLVESYTTFNRNNKSKSVYIHSTVCASLKMNISLKFIVKWFINLISLVLSICGALILVSGVIALTTFRTMPEATAYNMDAIPIVIIVYGCVLVATNICGTVEKKICRLTYFVVMGVMATITLILAIFAFETSKYVKESISDLLTSWFNEEHSSSNFSGLERSYECCGLTGPDSYNRSLPLSCCPYLINDLDPFNCTPIKAYQNGCVDSVTWAFTSVFRGAGKVCIAISLLGFAGSGATLFLLYLRKRR